MNFNKEVVLVLICASLVASAIITTQTVQATIDVYPGPGTPIQNAINTAPYGATIHVHSGTYNESIQLRWNVTIIGDGAETTIINGTGKPGPAVVTLDCPGPLSFSGFTIVNASADDGGYRYGILAIQTTPKAGVTYTISYCNIYGTGDPNEDQDYGFYGYGGKEDIVFTHNMVTQTGANAILVEVCTGATEISYNTLDSGCYGCDPIFFMAYGNLSPPTTLIVTTLQNVSYNTFNMGTGGPFDYGHRATGVSFNAPGGAFGVGDGGFTNMVASGNTFNNLQANRRAIGFWNNNGAPSVLSGAQVTHNLVNGIGALNSSGVDFIGLLTQNTVIGCNTIIGTEVGVYLRGGDAPGTTIRNNNIMRNTVGVNWTLGLTAVDAVGNWWGNATGPYNLASNPSGKGNPVTGNVNYSPYLTSPSWRAPAHTLLYINPTPVNKVPADVGTNFAEAVILSNYTNLMGFDIKLTWDNSLITMAGLDYTNALNTLWGTNPGKWSVVLNQSGAGYYELAANSISAARSNTGVSTLFNLTFRVAKSWTSVLSTAISFDLVKLSDNTTPTPNPIPAAATDGTYTMSAMVPGLEFKVEKRNKKTGANVTIDSPYHFESCDYFHVNVYVANVGSLTNYTLTIGFTTGFVAFKGVEYWGVFGSGSVSYTPGASVIGVNGSGSAWSGSEGLLCKLTFYVNFTVVPEHMWKYGSSNYATLPILITNAKLGFGSLGIIPMTGITVPSALSVEVDFVRGDVNCDGAVTMADISSVAYYYGQAVSSGSAQYDLNNDNFIDIYDIVTIATNYLYGT
jgi:hypothetical protein